MSAAYNLRRSALSPSAFQQICRLTTRAAGRRAPTPARKQKPVRAKPSRDFAAPKEEDNGIRWFEKDMATGETRRVAGNPDEIEAEELRQKIKKLETELREFENPLSNKVMWDMLGHEHKDSIKEGIKLQRQRTKQVTEGLTISLELPKIAKPLLGKLNTSLREAALEPFQLHRRKDLWRWYSRAKHNLLGLPRMIPERAWEVLWKTQSVKAVTNPDRDSHVVELYEDMISGGRGENITPDMQDKRLDAMIQLGRVEEVVPEWEQDYEATGGRNPQILRRGVELYTAAGDLERAVGLLREYLEAHIKPDPRIVPPLISAYARNSEDHRAFALYLLMRQKLESMKMSDYDAVIFAFLEHDKKDLALAVFRDMMLEGGAADKGPGMREEDRERIKAEILDRADALEAYSTSPNEVSRVRLTAMTTLPRLWQNRHFFGSWLRKLIAMNEVVAASKVVELMYERGIPPDAKQVNGLIAGLIRSGHPDLMDMGQTLGWSMIQKRLDQVAQRADRHEQARLGELIVHEGEEDVDLPVRVERPLPVGNMETFSVLALHYLIKEQWPYLRRLKRLVDSAKLKPDSVFVNYLLYMNLYERGPKWAWTEFTWYARKYTPDMESFSCLWTAEIRHIHSKSSDKNDFPRSRDLFKTMAVWLSEINSTVLAKAQQDFSTEIFCKIVQSFCDTKDLVGCLVAIHAVSARLNTLPGPEVASIITTAVSNLPEATQPTIRSRSSDPDFPERSRRQRMTMDQERKGVVVEILKGIQKRRLEALRRAGRSADSLTGEEKARENMNLFSEFLRMVLHRMGQAPNDIELAVQRAAEEMGVPGMATGDVDTHGLGL